MKRFILVTLLITIFSMSTYFVVKYIGDRTVSNYHVYGEHSLNRSGESGYYTQDFISGKPTAVLIAFGVFAVLMTANILYELYIVPKKKKRLENKG